MEATALPPLFFQNNLEATGFPNICCEIFRENMQKSESVSPVSLLEISLRRLRLL